MGLIREASSEAASQRKIAMSAYFEIEQTADSVRSGLGVRVHGPALSGDLPPRALEELRGICLEFPVTVVPGQELDAAALHGLARKFGRLEAHTAQRYHHPEFRELSYVANVGRDGSADQFGSTIRASGWHSDGSFLDEPFSQAMLYALEVPQKGGATFFANMYLAYENLPDDLKKRADGASAVHALGSGPDGAAAPSAKQAQEHPELYPHTVKPVVRVHPETGRKVLFVNAMHTSHVLGMGRSESDIFLRDLVDFGTQPEFVYKHEWNVGDLVIWDERSTLHRAGGGVAAGQRRVLLRALFKDAA
jgi:alpha-ketoglutarate-dependent taurine dioxygenase